MSEITSTSTPPPTTTPSTSTTTPSTNEKGEEPIPGLVKSESLLETFDAQLEIEQTNPNSPLYSIKSFEELGLKPEILKGVYAMGYNKPSKIQENSLPIIIQSSENLIAQSQSGTGKTAAFTLGMLNCVDETIQEPQTICICPSQELAVQIFEVVKKLGQFTTIKPILVIKEVDLPRTITNQIIIGTPGRLIDCIGRRQIGLRKMKMLVLDEADHMIGVRGMTEQSERIKDLLPKGIKILLFSATFSSSVDNYTKQYVPEPRVSIRLKREQLSVDKILQFYIDCESPSNKPHILSDIYAYISVGQSIVFVHTIETAKSLANKMREDGHSVSLLFGQGNTTEQRFAELNNFKLGKTKVLITTNVLARGIDILQVSLVINYDMPLDENERPDPVLYLHRVGRVGRFGRSGVAISLVANEHDKKKLMNIAEHLQRPVKELKKDEIEQVDEILRGLKDLTPLQSK
ncbi:DEAD-box RNA helicase [Cavenderia fasciculata]|uniref:RNA helicase n=1 Tax=Cavenderia fasciculata TaxID=261658 RepID=F4PGD4_CACFS|nr:DEAD-box RNA helicase [Cavenderia fasciculata]EGG24768.1 DEAD-box RNA helicase [Cavenderia fasciculata]|eukprot:XP_004362619.1 DEAD-box RNA helicase [Cavenderia fasciculata]